MKTILDITYGKLGNEAQKLDLYLPDAESFPIYVYFHGGGITGGDKTHVAHLCQYLPAHGIAIASVNYRMFPTAKYPEFIEDAAESVAWVKEHIPSYGQCTGIYVGGSSAGGYLSMMLAFDKRWYAANGISNAAISGYIHDAGQPTAHFNVLKYSGVDSRRVIVDETAPLYHIGTDETYPPMHFIVSDNDMKNRYEQTMLVLSTLRHFGHEEPLITHTVMHGKHCHYVNATDENGESVLGKLVESAIRNFNEAPLPQSELKCK